MRSDKDNLIVNLTFDFAIEIIKCSKILQQSHAYALSNQLLRAGISIGANVREAQNAESKADFIHKMKIAAKEADEVEYYLSLIQHSEDLPTIDLPIIQIQSIIKIISKIISSSKSN
ncbi:MAG: four helix bundle protein [Sphingobacteriales bacterium 17-39-43]|uniref:four helix bundle protein n=1 Tax=Daejeonella sp. TaxID=2805397 RepID=UPI000BD78274|nr:four helix bundle protein [Daejeonella sp.]OYX94857.1 MAG: four helix bundle protein [Sphingobacteriia bacterium 35-40-5]OYZ32856.1 MAG: four helix bundle protein [Sphingobacteriales bacterium 16-39-50]OYZ54463.1 MAG: four helix bundle protein [Sphingobacteriales bacterium 24-40-4]OZA26266.1 MAG: four helix bundle protein [Sphingobacteriales bacterium 17-39-43]OZA56680.1 MAG: four helix bundle protein [Sphingobacteriales bacterium 39-40-5]